MPNGTTLPTGPVVVYLLGGIIAMAPDNNRRGGVAHTLSVADLLAGVPGLDELGVDVEAHDLRAVPGSSLTIADIRATADEIAMALGAGARGAVVVQGTDTIAETSYLLDLLHDGEAPVVVTGAMRHPGMAGADGPANLYAAVATAASPAARGLGSIVVFADEVHAAAYVRNIHPTNTRSFGSPIGGPIGHVIEGRLRLLSRPTRRVTVRGTVVREPTVAVVTTCLDDRGELLKGLHERVDGVVVGAFGAGHVPAPVVPVLAELAEHIPVVLASRTGAGPVLSRTYGFPGSERDLLDRGLIGAGFLDPLKARVLLHLLLSVGASTEVIAGMFADAGGLGGAVLGGQPVV
jgi:L-asparaginase